MNKGTEAQNDTMVVDAKTKKIIETTVGVTIDKINSVALIDKLKAIKDETFKNTEQLLYNYKALKEHVEDEEGYFKMLDKSKSTSIVCYSKGKVTYNEDEALACRVKSYERSKSDLSRLEKALDKAKRKKEYRVLEIRYFSKKEDDTVYTFEEIAEMLEKDEKTVRTWKNKLIKEIAIFLFGSDAI